jgi:hypothetical protein
LREEKRMFETATRSSGNRRWHFERCGVWVFGDAITRDTAALSERELCMRCARSALLNIPVNERETPHGLKIRAAARRHMPPPVRP